MYPKGSLTGALERVIQEFEEECRRENARDPARPLYRVVAGQHGERGGSTRFLLAVAGGSPPDVFYGEQYLKWTFAQDYWYYSPYLSQCAQGYLPGSPFNETHWGDPAYIKLYDEAQATVDARKRCEIIHAMQKIDFEQGGYIIASYNQSIDLLAAGVQGFQPSASGYGLGSSGYDKAWLA